MKAFKIFLLTVFSGVIFLSNSCDSSQPQPFLKEEEMAALIADIKIAEATLYNVHAETFNTDSLSHCTKLIYDEIFSRHQVTVETYTRNLEYYISHPKKFEKLIKRVISDFLVPMKETGEQQKE